MPKDFPPGSIVPTWGNAQAGGLCTVDPPNMIGIYQLADVRNWYPYRRGWRKRGGANKFTAASVGSVIVNGMHTHVKADGTRLVVAATTAGEWRDVTDGTWGDVIGSDLPTDTSLKWRFVSALDTLIGVCGGCDPVSGVESIEFSHAWNPSTIGAGNHKDKDIENCTGAEIGDTVIATFDKDLKGCTLTAEVTEAYDPGDSTTPVITATITNDTASPHTISSGTVTVRIDKWSSTDLGIVGSERVDNGGFDTDTDWTKGTDWTIAGGVASKAAGADSNLSQDVDSETGDTYRVQWTLNSISGGTLTAVIGGVNGVARDEPGTYSEYITADDGSDLKFDPSAGDETYEIDDVSVKKVSEEGGTSQTSMAKDVKWHKGRLWITGYTENRNGIKYTAAGTIGIWTGDDAGEETFNTENDPSGMVGLGILENYMVFFKRHSVGILVGENDPELWQIRPQETLNGAVSAACIVDAPSGPYWISDEGPMRLTSSKGVEWLGADIRSSWNGLVWAWDKVDHSYLNRCHGIYFAPRNEVWWYIYDATAADRLKLVYSIDNNALTLHTDYAYSAMYGLDENNDPLTLTGGANGYIYTADNGWQDDAVDFADYITFPVMDMRDVENFKTFNSIIPILHSTSLSATLTVTPYLFYDATVITGNGDVWVIGAAGGIKYFSNALAMDTAVAQTEGHGLQVKLSSTGNWGASLYGFVVNMGKNK